MEPPNKGHFGTSVCQEAVLFLEARNDVQMNVLCQEVVSFLEGPLLKVLLYTLSCE